MRHIRNVRELREALKSGQNEFRLCLNGGVFSRKTICLSCDGRFSVFNGIDGSTKMLTGKQLYTESNIGRGMRCGAFLAEDQ
jgi:hypothetical protein